MRMRRVVVVGAVVLAGCGIDPAPPTFLGGAAPTSGGGVEVRFGQCAAGRLRGLTVDVYPDDPDEAETAPDLWRVTARADPPRLAAGGTIDVVLGSTPPGMVEDVPLDGPLPEGELVRVSVDTFRGGVGLFFVPRDLVAGAFVVSEGDTIPAGELDERLADLCD